MVSLVDKILAAGTGLVAKHGWNITFPRSTNSLNIVSGDLPNLGGYCFVGRTSDQRTLVVIDPQQYEFSISSDGTVSHSDPQTQWKALMIVLALVGKYSSKS